MAHEELIERTIRNLGKATARQIGEILHAKGLVSSIESGDATCRRVLADLISKGEIKKEGSCYMLPNLSGFGEHDKKLTEALVKIMKLWKCYIYREHSIEEVGLRPDAIVIVVKDNKACCIILEVVNTEPDNYLKQKFTTWKGWKNNLSYLSSLTMTEVPFFIFCTYGRQVEGIPRLDSLIRLMEVLNE